MNVEKLYQGLRRIQDRGEIGTAYTGCGTVVSDLDVLDGFYEYILDKYEDSMPDWAETFMQIYSWQFQSMHEMSQVYYENFYGDSEYPVIIRVADFLRKNGYHEIAEPYAAAAVDCERCQYPADKAYLLPDDWIDNNGETIWNFYVDILEKHRGELMCGEGESE